MRLHEFYDYLTVYEFLLSRGCWVSADQVLICGDGGCVAIGTSNLAGLEGQESGISRSYWNILTTKPTPVSVLREQFS